VLNSLKNLYKKLGTSAALLSGLRAQDEQIAQLRATLATLLSEKHGLSAPDEEAAKAKIEGLLAYQAVSKDETERLRALYESAAGRLAAAEAEIAALREKLSAMERALEDRGGRP
jgi:chromosome segregation ATPase